MTRVERDAMERLLNESTHSETTLAVLYAPWCPFCQAMVGGFEAAAAAFKNGKNKKVDVVKFRADGDEKEWSKENLSLKSFPTILLFPEGRSGHVKLGSEVATPRAEHFRRVRRRKPERQKNASREERAPERRTRRVERARNERRERSGDWNARKETVFERQQSARRRRAPFVRRRLRPQRGTPASPRHRAISTSPAFRLLSSFRAGGRHERQFPRPLRSKKSRDNERVGRKKT